MTIDDVVRSILDDQIPDDPSETTDDQKRIWHLAVRRTVEYVKAWMTEDPNELADQASRDQIVTVFTAYSMLSN